MIFIKKNFSYGVLASDVTLGATQITVQAGHTLPTAVGYFRVLIWNVLLYPSPSSDPNLEIVTASYSGTPNIYNITRAQESTVASTHSTGDKVAMTITAGVSDADAYLLGSKEIDETNIAGGKVPYYDDISGKIKYTTLSGGGDMMVSTYDPRGLGKIGTESLEGGVLSPGNTKYYGTDNSGNKGFYDISQFSNVLFQWHGVYNGVNNSHGCFVTTNATIGMPTSDNAMKIYLWVRGNSYAEVYQAKFVKPAGISTVTIYLRADDDNNGGTTYWLCDIGGQQGSLSSGGDIISGSWFNFTVDVSPLVDNNVYTVSFQMKTNNASKYSYVFNIMGFGS